MTKDQFLALLEKYHRQQLNASELAAFLDAAGDPVFEAMITDNLYRELEHMKKDADAGPEREQKVWDAITARQHKPRVHFMRRWGWAAAAVLLLAGTGAYFLASRKPAPVVVQPPDIAPGKEGALLTLADGSEMVLDSLANGVIATQGGASVLMKNGQLTYDPTDRTTGVVAYNTMRIPKGRQFRLTLPDGTNVWLNAASSLRYPTAFTGKERRVEVKGEAYFEVAKNAAMPFRVNVDSKAEIEVLGTHFNVNAYENEASIKTTLLEGSVKVLKMGKQAVLKPGQQAQTGTQAEIAVINDVDVDKIMAWKNGLFNFDGSTLKEVMRQLERWYDIEVVYEKGVEDVEFMGEMTKGISLNGVLLALGKSGVHFRLEGRKLTVLP